MSRATPQMRRLAQHLIVHEIKSNKSAEAEIASFSIVEKLRPEMARLMGHGGFRALLSRSLALANDEIRWLRALHVKADGSLEGLEELHAQLDPAELREGKVVLLAQLLGLLIALIGPGLTARLLGDIWPKLALKTLNFGNGVSDEKTK